MKLVSIVSGGKDSIYSYYLMKQLGFDIDLWITFIPRNEESYMLHVVNLEFVKKQAELSGVEHKIFAIEGEKEKEVEEMYEILGYLKGKEKFEGIVSGAIRSEYQKHRIDMIAERLEIPSYSPLWHKNSEKLLREVVENGFEFLIVFGGEDLKEWIGKKITKNNVNEFLDFLKKIGSDACGEGGEFESFVVKTPFWEKEMEVDGKIIKEDGSYRYLIKNAR